MKDQNIRFEAVKIAAQAARPDMAIESVLFDAQRCVDWIKTGSTPAPERAVPTDHCKA